MIRVLRVTRKILIVFGAIVFLAAGWACAPDFAVAVFSYKRHPDLPRSKFLDGQLGVLRPTYARSYLVIAYRHLTGIGLSRGEKEQARDYYKDRATGWWDRNDVDWQARYRLARGRVPLPAPATRNPVTRGELAYKENTNSFALNCVDDAYRTALHTLESRIGKFGPKSAAVREWSSAQDQVFHNCDTRPAVFPPPAARDLPPIIRADREYQIAAAHFYAGSYEQARGRFAAIGNDPASPWQPISRYLVLRTLGRMRSGASTASLKPVAAAILADPKLLPIHGMTAALLHRFEIHDGDPVYLHELAKTVSSRGQENGLREELWNFGTVYDAQIGDGDPNAVFPPDKPTKPDLKAFREDDLTLWIFLFQSRDPASAKLCFTRWQQTHSLPWLVAALTHASYADAERIGLLEAARAVPPESPAYVTVAYHYFRLLLEHGDNEPARAGLDAVMNRGGVASQKSVVNLFRGLRLMAAPNIDEFLKLAPRQPTLITDQMNIGEEPEIKGGGWAQKQFPSSLFRFAPDSTGILNRRVPLKILREAATNNALPAHLHRELLLTAFARAVILKEDAADLARSLSTAAPEIENFAATYQKESTAEGRRFAGVFFLLHQPDVRPFLVSGISRQSPNGRLDSFRDNWWCPLAVTDDWNSKVSDRWVGRQAEWQKPAQSDAFLSKSEVAAADQEFAEMSRAGSGPTFLGSVVLSYAKAHREDPRVPEALHLVVRAVRYGCTDSQSSNIARDAFRFLHLNFPNSIWTKRTPIWG